MKKMIVLLSSIFMSYYCLMAHAETSIDDHQVFEKYSVHYSLFNSTFIQPDVAAIYDLKRSRYENLLNVSISPKDGSGTIAATITGTSKNLMQQLKTLKIIEVKEDDAVYYLIPVRVSGKEILHFDLQVKPQGEDKTLAVKFVKTVYAD